MKVLIVLLVLFLPCLAFSIEITSDTLEHFDEEQKSVATGNVHMVDPNFEMRAQKAIYYEKTNEVEAYKDFYYNDSTMTAWAEEGKFNIDKKTALLKNALIHIKDQDFWIRAQEIERLSEIKYKARKAKVSTCEPEPDKSQPWCFTGEFVDFVVDDAVVSKLSTFKVKDVPVLFSPIFSGPGGNNRKSGFLPLKFGNSNTRGFRFSPAYYLVIDSNKDATFYLDYFSKTGLGKGLEYRYLDFDTKGMWHVYNINDKDLDKDFFEIRGIHVQKFRGIDLLVDVNYVNKKDFYREYGDTRQISKTFLFKDYGKDLSAEYDRFLQSSVELSVPAVQSRFYLLGQAWKDLRWDGESPPLKTELGYVVSPFKIGPFTANFNINAGEFYKEDGLKGQRFQINPKLSYTMGDSVRLTQTLSARSIFYDLTHTSPYEDTSHREMLQYDVKGSMRLYNRNENFTHIAEPFVEGVFIEVNNKPPVLEEAEFIEDTSLIRAGVYNKLIFRKFTLEARIAQVYDFRAKNDWDNLYPILFETKLSFWKISLGFDTYQNITKKRTETFNNWIGFNPDPTTSISLGHRYTRDNTVSPSYLWAPTIRGQYRDQGDTGGINNYSMTIVKQLTEKWSFAGNINYDKKQHGERLRDTSLDVRYAEKCWASIVSLKRKPIYRDGRETSEFSFIISFELKGLGGPIKLL